MINRFNTSMKLRGLTAIAVCVVAMLSMTVQAQSFPNAPVTFVVPGPAGSPEGSQEGLGKGAREARGRGACPRSLVKRGPGFLPRRHGGADSELAGRGQRLRVEPGRPWSAGGGRVRGRGGGAGRGRDGGAVCLQGEAVKKKEREEKKSK